MNNLTQLQTTYGPVTISTKGNGPNPIILIHGFPGRTQDFRWLTPYLENNFTLYHIALPGHGVTPKMVFPATGLKEIGYFIEQCIDSLQISSFTLIGHSMGCPIAIWVASKRVTQCNKVVLISPVGLREHRALRKGNPQLIQKMLQNQLLRPITTRLLRIGFRRAGFPKGISVETMEHVMEHVTKFSFNEYKSCLQSWRSINDSSQRTAIIWTTNDQLIEEDIYQELSDFLSPSLNLCFPTGGHNPQKWHAETIGVSLLNWLN
jgi:pimeloyl-ACP methyl ester carboxylesterase